ncbi:MAG: AAA family ATPase [Methanobrevibacter sp.]|jgi:DNA-binding MarR family transcriptional regulator|nr:AAA family ATPase [Methanobrevibacter sp.]
MGTIPIGIPKNIDKYFYNRNSELVRLKSLIDTLNDDVSNQILLTGNRGVGKSFLLKKFISTVPNNILTAYIDISKILAMQKGELTEEKVLYEILEEMNKSLKSQGNEFKKIHITLKNLVSKIKNQDYDFKGGGSIFSIPIPEITTNYERLSQFVMDFPQNIVDSSNGKIKGFVIIFDEFQFLSKLNSTEAFFWLIRSHVLNQDNVTYIFTGSTSTTSEMVDKLNGIEGAFGTRMAQFNIYPFSKETTKNYLNEKISDIKFDEEGFNRFYKCTRGYPSLINSFTNIMDKDIVYTEEEVINEFFTKLDQIAVNWIILWSTLSKNEKDIVTTIVENESIKWKELIEKLDFSQNTFTKNIKKLKNKAIISHLNSTYKVEDYMLLAWLKHRKDIDGFYPL